LFPIVNPIGNTPIFLSLTRGLSDHGRSALARMVAINGLVLIVTARTSWHFSGSRCRWCK